MRKFLQSVKELCSVVLNTRIYVYLMLSFIPLGVCSQSISSKVKVNQIGYITNEAKWAYVSDTIAMTLVSWDVKTSGSGVSVYHSISFGAPIEDAATDEFVYKIDFSDVQVNGTFYIDIEGVGRSFDFEINDFPYNDVFKILTKSFYYQRSGVELDSTYAGIWARSAEYSNDAYIYLGYESGKVKSGDYVNTNGSWRDAGDPNKKVVPAALSVYQMLTLYEYHADEVETADLKIPQDATFPMSDYLKEIKFTTDWLLRMQREDGAVWHAVTQQDFYLLGMGHLDKNPRYLMPVSTTATADLAAALATAYRVFKHVNIDYADSCLFAAEKAWQALLTDSIWNNPTINGALGTPQYPELHGYSQDPPGINYTANYGDTNDSDEILWSAAELYIATGKTTYKAYFDAHLVTGMYYGSGWNAVANIANLSYARAFKDKPDATAITLNNAIEVFADIYLALIKTKGFGVCLQPADYYWASNQLVGHYAYSFIMAYEILGNIQYKEAALSLLNYILGANSLNQVYISGVGDKPVEHIFHLPSLFDGISEVVPGLVAGGPNQNPDHYDIPQSTLIATQNPPPAKCYIDSDQSFATNEPTLTQNAPWVFTTGYFYKNDFITSVSDKTSTGVKLFPNPVNNMLYVEAKVSNVSVYNISGQLMIESQKNMIDISKLVAGVYIVKITNANDVVYSKIVKQ